MFLEWFTHTRESEGPKKDNTKSLFTSLLAFKFSTFSSNDLKVGEFLWREKKNNSKITNAEKAINFENIVTRLYSCWPLFSMSESTEMFLHAAVCRRIHQRVLSRKTAQLCSKISAVRLLTPWMGPVLDTEL